MPVRRPARVRSASQVSLGRYRPQRMSAAFESPRRRSRRSSDTDPESSSGGRAFVLDSAPDTECPTQQQEQHPLSVGCKLTMYCGSHSMSLNHRAHHWGHAADDAAPPVAVPALGRRAAGRPATGPERHGHVPSPTDVSLVPKSKCSRVNYETVFRCGLLLNRRIHFRSIPTSLLVVQQL